MSSVNYTGIFFRALRVDKFSMSIKHGKDNVCQGDNSLFLEHLTFFQKPKKQAAVLCRSNVQQMGSQPGMCINNSYTASAHSSYIKVLQLPFCPLSPQTHTKHIQWSLS